MSTKRKYMSEQRIMDQASVIDYCERSKFFKPPYRVQRFLHETDATAKEPSGYRIATLRHCIRLRKA